MKHAVILKTRTLDFYSKETSWEYPQKQSKIDLTN